MMVLPKYMHEYSLNDFFISVNGLFRDYERDLRDELSKIYGNDKILFLDSGRSALNLILKHLNLPEGSGVAVPVNVCQVVVDVVLSNKLKPVFIDIDDNLTMSLADLKKKKSKGTRAVIAVHAFGNVCDIPSIMKFARQNGMVVIEDSAQTLDASFNKRLVCTFADYSFVSLDVTKHISSFGGGILVTKDELFYKKIRYFLKDRESMGFGVLLNFIAFKIFSFPPVYSIFTRYFIKKYKALSYYTPKNRKLSGIGMALAFSQVKKLASVGRIRRNNARNFMFNLPGDVKIYSSTKQRAPSYLFLPVGVKNPAKVESFLCRHYVDLPKAPPLLNSLPQYKIYHSKCSNAEKVYKSLVLLPTYRGIGVISGVIARSIMHINRS